MFPLIQPAQPHLWLPRMYGVSARETAVNMLTRALPATADSLTLLDVPPQLMGLPGPILLASTRGAICTLVWLHDSHEGPQLGAAFAVTGIFSQREDLLRALQCLPGEAATLWHRVEFANLEWRYSQTISLVDSNAVVAEVVVATANMRAALTLTGGDSLSSETSPYQFRPGSQSVLDGQFSSLSSGDYDPCVAAPGMQAPGTLRVVYCSGPPVWCRVTPDIFLGVLLWVIRFSPLAHHKLPGLKSLLLLASLSWPCRELQLALKGTSGIGQMTPLACALHAGSSFPAVLQLPYRPYTTQRPLKSEPFKEGTGPY